MYYKAPLQPFQPVIENTQPLSQTQRYFRDTFYGTGQDSYTHATAQDQVNFERLTNVMPIAQGVFQRRWGYASFASGLAGNVVRMYKYQSDATGVKRILVMGATFTAVLDETGTIVTANLLTPTAAALRMAFSRDYAFFTDAASQQKKWINAGSVTNWGTPAAATAITFGANAGGAVTLLHGRRYYVVEYNSTTGHYTDLNPVSVLSSPICNQNQALTLPAASADTQVTNRVVLATLDGGDTTQLYIVNDGVSNYLAANATTYTDNTPESVLSQNNVAFQVDEFGRDIGVAGNTPPPVNINFITKHLGRLFGAVGRTLYFSKSIDEVTTSTGLVVGRYEECWPATNFFDVSEEAETVKGLYTDGSTLFIGTERHIRRLQGNDSLNFQKPDIVFNQVGLVNHDVWKGVFVEGQPAGTMWLTPDLRVIFSDFNTYKDVGTPIQDVLNTTNTAALSACWGMFASNGAYDIYMLAIPTGSNTTPDTLCIYDLRSQRWLVWLPATPLAYGLFNINNSGVPQWLVGATTNVFQFLSTQTSDNGTGIPVTIRSPWWHFGEPTSRKTLNEIEVVSEDNGTLSITAESARTGSDFNTPNVVISGGNPILSTLGAWKLFVASQTSAGRYYRFTFTSPSTSTVTNVLENLSIEYAPFRDV